uniref:Uncharacterized protein n=2 Tax=Marmotini TaxID=337730 RepID=A0A8C9QD48_SPEDA
MDKMYAFSILYSFVFFKYEVLKCTYYDRKYVCLLGFVKWSHVILRNLFCKL